VVIASRTDRGNKPELNDAQRILANEAARREAIFQQSVDSEKTRGDALSRPIRRGAASGEEEPVTKAMRDFDSRLEAEHLRAAWSIVRACDRTAVCRPGKRPLLNAL